MVYSNHSSFSEWVAAFTFGSSPSFTGYILFCPMSALSKNDPKASASNGPTYVTEAFRDGEKRTTAGKPERRSKNSVNGVWEGPEEDEKTRNKHIYLCHSTRYSVFFSLKRYYFKLTDNLSKITGVLPSKARKFRREPSLVTKPTSALK